jgi:hypothetical protein
MRITPLLASAVALSCSKPVDYESPTASSSVASPAAQRLAPSPRVFARNQLAKVACVKDDGTNLVGTDCPGGFVVFGPVAPVAAGSNVTLSFTITPKEDALVSLELGAESDKVLYARSSNLVARGGVATKLTLESRLQLDTQTLESRIAVFSSKPASFVLSGLELAIK